MINVEAPKWFKKELKNINSSLSVGYVDGQGWQILQSIPSWKNLGYWEGMSFKALVMNPEHVMYIPDIGSRAFQELRHSWTPRYNYMEYCKEFNIRYE